MGQRVREGRIVTAQPVDPVDVDGLLDVLADYADAQAERDLEARRHTLAVALATQELYESRAWVAEWLEQKPEPKRPTSRWKPDSINRFQQWQAWSNERRGRRAMASMTTYRMVNAATVASAIPNFPHGKLDSAQPFLAIDWMRKNGYTNRIPEVWTIAVEMAGSVDRVTEHHTREALKQWKHDHLAGRGAARAGRNSALHSKRVKAELAFEDLLYMATKAENGREELQGYLDFVKSKLEERRR